MKIVLRYKGGAGSGFEDHAGRPGQVGGSVSSGIGSKPKERKIFSLTAQQLQKTTPENELPAIPSDDAFKASWAKHHRGKVTGWGMGKRDYMLRRLRTSAEYQRGIWQGRADKARGLQYSEERTEKSYNLGYHLGYVEYESNRHGWDEATKKKFDEMYVND